MTLSTCSPVRLLGILLALAPACNGAGTGDVATDTGTTATTAEPDPDTTADLDPTTTATPTTGATTTGMTTADGSDTTVATTGDATTGGTTGDGALLQRCMETAALQAELNAAHCQCDVNIGAYDDVPTCLAFIPPPDALTPCGCELYIQDPGAEQFFDCTTPLYAEVVACAADVVCGFDPAPLLACLHPFYEKFNACASLPMAVTAQVELQCNGVAPFDCTSGEQIPETWKCNYNIDCMDASEELGCPDSFMCADGSEFFPTDYVCDTFPSCADGSDEFGCPTFMCKDGETIPAPFQCNEVTDCTDGSDEGSMAGCAVFMCKSGEEVPASWECDDEADCMDGSDETDCP